MLASKMSLMYCFDFFDIFEYLLNFEQFNKIQFGDMMVGQEFLIMIILVSKLDKLNDLGEI